VASSDWSLADGLRFWYYGRNTGDQLALELRDNRAPDPGPAGWRLAWHDEFNGRVGQPADPARWSPEIGDGTAQGIPGWGNNEREYYTDSRANASLDGQGHLLISVRPADGSLSCYYGPCEYTSARLISQDKVEIGRGRIEARIKVPAGAGLWPAFWALGSNIGQVGWPGSGEIDMMEYLGRNPNDIFGTLHGPGYSGGSGITGRYTLPRAVSDDYHVFAIEWQSDRIDWYVDDTPYHSAMRADVGTNQWVFNKPFFMIFNVAVGGYLGGAIDAGLTFPRSMAIDYIRVFAAPDTAERFEAGFRDDFRGWQEVSLPFSDFVRSARQPIGAPDDGLTLDEVWGYGFRLPGRGLEAPPLYLDQVRVMRPSSAVVRNPLDQGSGSLRNAVAAVADGGTITFDPSLAGATITLASGPIWLKSKGVTIDATTAPGITLLGTGSDRLLIVDPTRAPSCAA
jgi:beta-glucanase (GH16 family)